MSDTLVPTQAELAEYHYIDAFRVIRAAGKSDAAKAKAVAQFVADEVSTALRTRPPTLPDDRDAVIAEADLLYLVKLADWAAGQGFCEIEGIEEPEEWCFRKWGELGPADGNGYSAEALRTALSKHDRNEGGDDGE